MLYSFFGSWNLRKKVEIMKIITSDISIEIKDWLKVNHQIFLRIFDILKKYNIKLSELRAL